MSMRDKVLKLYHLLQVYPGEKRIERTICFVYSWKGLKVDVDLVCKHQHMYKMSKNSGRKKYRLLVPEKICEITKWSQVKVDCWGIKTVQNKSGEVCKIHIMTMVYPVTCWFELAQLKGKPNAFRCSEHFNYVWLAYYLCLRENIFNNEGEFMATFPELCHNMGLKQRPLSSWNP